MASEPVTFVVGAKLDASHLARLRAAAPEAEIVLAADEAALLRAAPRADALLGVWGISADLLAAAPRLRWIQTTGAGVERLLIPELLARDIVLTNLSGVHAPNIAEHVLAMMLAFARGLRPLLRDQEAGIWHEDGDGPPPTFELTGQTLLVVGLGDIGAALARRAHGLEMRVLATRRHPNGTPPYVERLGASSALDDLLPEADHVAICLPLTPETRQLFDARRFAGMKTGAYLYNIGRGDIVDQDALIDALRTGHLGGAGLDVTSPEPLPAESPLWTLPNVLITAHTSGRSPLYWNRGIEIVAENVRRFLANEPLHNVVDQRRGY